MADGRTKSYFPLICMRPQNCTMPASSTKSLLLIVLSLVVVSLTNQSAHGQAWLRQMFKGESTHDFGDVQLGEVPEYRFQFENVFNETFHIQSINSSCGCTIATASKRTLKTWEKGEIICKFNTPAVGTGQKQATITVKFDRPYRAEMQLTVKGNIVTGVSIEPKQIDFGQVVENKLPVRIVKLKSSGNPNFRIRDVKSVFKHISVQVKETGRNNGMVSYNIVTQLKDSAPKGFTQDQLYLVVEEGRNYNGTPQLKQIPLPFNAKVTSALQLSPEVLSLGSLDPGEVIKKKVFLKSDKPFFISDVRCESEAFSVKAASKAKKMHIVEVVYTAGNEKLDRHECELSFYVRYADAQSDPPTSSPSGRLKAIIEVSGQQGGADTDVINVGGIVGSIE